ncbi:type II secretion system F family protein [Gordonia sp. CPCC 205515]|uniref:type II secretion system F family protein n=1 Tax=Gordonia sp. CPCC 205515 TaxID=3140791 RepID=UPI003AF36117
MTPGVAVVLLAGALWVWPSSRWALYRVTAAPPSRRGEPRWLRPRHRDDQFAVAATIELFAVCLRAGLPTATALTVVARFAPPDLAIRLARTADLLELGADPEQAWSATSKSGRSDSPTTHYEQIATLARRSARAGSGFADGLAELAEQTRRHAHDAATAAAERAGVAISGPLGLCFLPAFVCLGIVPVVIGLAGGILG